MPVLDTAGQAAFRQLLGKQVTDGDIRSMAKIAADAYVSERIDPNVTISKLAAERHLGDQHVARICEATNVNIYGELFKEAAPDERANIEFPLARPPASTAAQAPEPPGAPLHAKVASAPAERALVDMDFLVGPPAELRAGRVEEPLAKTAAEIIEDIPHPSYARRGLQKLAIQRQEAEGETLLAMEKLGQATARLHRELRGVMVVEPETVIDIYRDACHLGLGKEAAAAITAARETIPLCRVKLAGMVDEEYLPENDELRIVNGEQKVLRLLRAVHQRRGEAGDGYRRLNMVDHGREEMLERVQNLSS